ncbi:MAG TPA: AAA family ATPase [Gemmatimonadaceae bacterium]|nr:AAA family ATPase [Gemmatimonadaceae bacterium]
MSIQIPASRASDGRATSLRITLFGRVAASINDRELNGRSVVVTAALLLFALDRGRRWTRDEMALLLWPDADAATQRSRLRWLLAKLRRLGLPFTEAGDVLSLPASIVDIDTDHVAALPPDEIAPLLPSYAPTFSAAFERWLDEQRELLRVRATRTLNERANVAREHGQWPTVISLAEAVLRVDRWNESAVLSLADGLCRVGDRETALQTLEAFLRATEDRPELQVEGRLLVQRIKGTPEPRFSPIPRLVGRDAPLAQLAELLRVARLGQGGALLLVGPAGIGKTRLLDETIAQARAARMRPIRLRCQRSDSRRPLTVVATLAHEARLMRGAAGCAPEALAEIDRFLQPGSGEAAPHERENLPSPQLVRRRLMSALIDLLAAVTWESPLVIAVDDAQWMDAASVAFWKDLVPWAGSHAVAIVMSHRPGRGDDELTTVAPVVAIDPLDTEAADALLADLEAQSGRPLGAHVRADVAARGAGNPLFLIELARHQGQSAGAPPRSLTDAFDGSLDTLSASALRILQVAAILGPYATMARVEHVAQLPRAPFVDAVIELDAAGILKTDSAGILVGHGMWSDAALTRVSPQVARLLHRYAAEGMQQELAEQPSLALLWETVRHWENAGLGEDGLRTLQRGAEHLAQSGFPDAAAEACERAIRQVKDARESLALRRRRIELLVHAGLPTKVIEEVDRYEQLAREVDPMHDAHNPFELDRERAVVDAGGDWSVYLQRMLRCASAEHASVGHRLRAAKETAKMAEVKSSSLLHDAYAIARSLEPQTESEKWDRTNIELLFHRRFGDVHKYLELAKQLTARCRAAGDTSRLAGALDFAGVGYRLTGRFADARAALAEAIELYSRSGALGGMIIARQRLIGMSLDVDAPAVTRRLLDEARGPIQTLGSRGIGMFKDIVLPTVEAELEARHGDPEEALRRAPSLDRAIEHHAAAWGLRMLAIHLHARTRLGREDDVSMIADGMRRYFERPDFWHDWPAAVYAAHLDATGETPAARQFARRYLNDIRREVYDPPAVLAALAARAESPRAARQHALRPMSA